MHSLLFSGDFLSAGVRATRGLVLAGCLATLAACSTTGNSFSSLALSRIIPGQTTQQQASEILGAQPASEYCRNSGACVVRWAHKFTWVTDAAYLRQELWLQFAPDGTFQRVVKKINLPFGIHAGAQQSAQSAATSATPGYASESTAVTQSAASDQATTAASTSSVSVIAPVSASSATPAASTRSTSSRTLLAVPTNTTSPVWTQPLHDTVLTYPVSN